KHLQRLYDLLVRPLELLIGRRHLVFGAFKSLHYLPFHALHDGTSYLIESREVPYSPSATALLECLARTPQLLNNALLSGVSGGQAELINDEFHQLSSLFVSSLSFIDECAALAELFRESPRADVLHLACHAQFRPDNPFFSSLRLGDGWLTVREAYGLKLNC